MSADEVEETLFRVTSVLEGEQIPYAVMGGMAVRVYSIPRATQDVDITIALDRRQLPQLFDKLQAQGCSIPTPYLSGWLDTVSDMPLFKIIRHLGGHSVDVDIFLAESGFQESIIQRRRRCEVSGRPISLVSPEDLLLLKLIAGRPRDLVDAQDLLFAMGTLDEAYLHNWAVELGVSERLDAALREAQG